MFIGRGTVSDYWLSVLLFQNRRDSLELTQANSKLNDQDKELAALREQNASLVGWLFGLGAEGESCELICYP
jgi:hypothetical protein